MLKKMLFVLSSAMIASVLFVNVAKADDAVVAPSESTQPAVEVVVAPSDQAQPTVEVVVAPAPTCCPTKSCCCRDCCCRACNCNCNCDCCCCDCCCCEREKVCVLVKKHLRYRWVVGLKKVGEEGVPVPGPCCGADSGWVKVNVLVKGLCKDRCVTGYMKAGCCNK